MTFYITLTMVVFLISLIGTRLLILSLRGRKLLADHPNFRSNHSAPTPRGGGLAVVVALSIGLMIADIPYAILFSFFLLAAVSLLDDLISLPAWVRLLVHGLAALISVQLFPPLFGDALPLWLDRALVALAWVWCINAFNFMDGIDGITATEMISVGLGFCLIYGVLNQFPAPLAVYGMVVASAGMGFLWWNWHPAKIFLGDVGSIPIGFIVGWLLLLAVHSGLAFPALILPAYYISDSAITIIRRAWAREKIWQAHSKHYYQCAVRGGRRHDTVVCYIIGLNILLFALAAFSVLDSENDWLYAASAYMAVFMILGFFAHTPYDPDNEPF